MDEDVVLDDEKKPFDALTANDDDTQPDPDEQIMLESGNGRVWQVKIPSYLMKRWSAVDEEGVPLATIRIYDAPDANKPPRIFVQVPPDPSDPDSGSGLFEMDMTNQDVNNQIVVAEREKAPRSRARTTIMTGKVKHNCQLTPASLSDGYSRLMKKRTIQANTPQKHIKMIDDGVSGGKGAINRLSSGITSAKGFSELTRPKVKPAKGAFERFTRMPRNELLDLLFGFYRQREHWPIKVLREKTQQPENYLKEVLSEIAVLHRSGEHNGTWELKPSFKGDGIKGENVPQSSQAWVDGDAKMEDGDEDEEDEDEDEDMEEVS
ncbi:hypothetical protein FA95DRAFT_1483907 [Auriscalpium vulgare]|uniref:Uncharacterized protein n=1 Tax=Auriscalpium vulgare TaxID=40419 RepID=A0ACB8S866_9AGAM|nr:hypothetical protein FA95DRAFT_1483907 [Auriscalpium vulgare]